MKGWTLIVGSVLLVGLFAGGVSASTCCLPKPGWSNGQVTLNCADCEKGTPYCGKGRCNLFGCNCDGGCREGTCGGFFSPSQIHDIVDSDKDGRISHAEANEYLIASGVHPQHFPPVMAVAASTGADQSEIDFLPDDTISEDQHLYDMCHGHDPLLHSD